MSKHQGSMYWGNSNIVVCIFVCMHYVFREMNQIKSNQIKSDQIKSNQTKLFLRAVLGPWIDLLSWNTYIATKLELMFTTCPNILLFTTGNHELYVYQKIGSTDFMDFNLSNVRSGTPFPTDCRHVRPLLTANKLKLGDSMIHSRFPDWPFHHFWDSESIERCFWATSSSPIDWFWYYKIVAGSVGLMRFQKLDAYRQCSSIAAPITLNCDANQWL